MRLTMPELLIVIGILAIVGVCAFIARSYGYVPVLPVIPEIPPQ